MLDIYLLQLQISYYNTDHQYRKHIA